MAGHVTVLEPGEPALDLFGELHEDSTDESGCESVESMAEVLMAGSEPHGPPWCTGPRDGNVGPSRGHANDGGE